MNTPSKLLLCSMLCVALTVQADPDSQETKTERSALHTIVAIGLRCAETAAGIQMLWLGSPHITDFFYFSEDETEIRPGTVYGNSYRQTIRKRGMLPLGFIKLIRRIPTRLVGGALTFDGLQGLWKEYLQIVEDRVTRERELLFGQKKR